MQEKMQEPVNQEVVNDDSTVNQKLAYIEGVLKFLYQMWWRVEATGLDRLPVHGPALIVGNTSGYIPWPALMLIHALTKKKNEQRTVYTLIDSNISQSNKLNTYLQTLNCLPWSYDNAKQLLEKGEIIAIFPEDNKVMGKTKSTQNRTKRFDWTKFLPAVELHVPIFPLATLGVDEANMVLDNSDFFSQILNVTAFPITQFVPYLPFPFNLSTLPVPWKMHIMPALRYDLAKDREDIQEKAKKVALRSEGDIQAEINRLLRSRSR